jgi:poly [ADP-ribose] polymerase 10/14/15
VIPSFFEATRLLQIQNRRLSNLYQTNSRAMMTCDGDTGLNEMTLFHGTTIHAAEDIIRHGFNRSFCKSSSLYGQGVYFAKEASLAATFSPPAIGSNDR